jgi:dolichol-phosphate mannosyltransferase
LVRQVSQALTGIHWEMIIVDDDSPDGTAREARGIFFVDPRVRCVQRVGRRGLSTACIEGMLSCSTRLLAVMDADLQHDPALLRLMYERLKSGDADVVVGSRYIAGGSMGEWDQRRQFVSRFATKLAGAITHHPVADTMSGFFALRRDILDIAIRRLSTRGFKILLDILSALPADVRVIELPYTFRNRMAGESKLSVNVIWEFLLLLADKLVGRYVPVNFLAFGAIGGIGIGVHFLVMLIVFKAFGANFAVAQSAATAVAILFNYTINNLLTYAGASLKGVAWVKGLVSFYLICGIGAFANVGVADYLFGQQKTSWVLASLAGIAMSSVWNYAVSARYTWKST